ncbi:MAG TPA: response regulator transcription factor [Candidatus Gastranaerophilaceae bacterium]|nr:response regulator transcription factor [Candidatus Gastranaerophilaceae bacterium]
MSNVRVLLVEDHTMTRMGLSLVLEKAQGIELIAEAEDGLQGVEMAQKLLPDVILMDIGLPNIDGIEATRRIKESGIESRVLIFTSRDNEDDVFACFKAGADGYIMKGASPMQTTNAILAVNEGTAWLDPAIAKIVLSNIQKGDSPSQSPINSSFKNGKNIYGLTERELEVLALIVEGLSNPQIADKLVITRATAKAHVHSILQKLYVDDRTKAAVMAMKEGLV